MKKLAFLVVLLSLFIIPAGIFFLAQKAAVITPLPQKPLRKNPKPLEKYAFENLRKTTFQKSDITLGENIETTNQLSKHIFYYSVEGKKASGLITIPRKSGDYPVVVMFRGYAEKQNYFSGIGTKRAAEIFAKNGLITVAPDFLDYGQSDPASQNALEARFQTYTTALTLLASLENINNAFASGNYSNARIDIAKVGIWGHSNGGHIALSILSITEKPYPTVLWNPVSKPFPYSILYFTDEYEDNGKELRKILARFEKEYDIDKYSPPNYYSLIKAPIQLHQGEKDEAVPQRWSDQLVTLFKNQEKDIDYFVYPGDDHNFSKGGWNTAVIRSLEFYQKEFSARNT